MSHEFAAADPLVELPGGLGGLDAELVAKLPLTLLVLPHRQVRLVEPGVAAHHQPVYLLPAQVAGNQPLAHVKTFDITASIEPEPGHLVQRFEMLQPQPLAQQQRPLFERCVLEQVPPVELESLLVPGEGVLLAARQVAAGLMTGGLVAGDLLPPGGGHRLTERLGVYPQVDAGVQQKAPLAVHHDRVL